jgi:hypothetical protein
MSGITNGSNGNIVGTQASPIDPLLASLATNGGLTQTMLQHANSPVVGAGSAILNSVDQRGFPRPVNGSYDIGAVQLQGITLTATAGTPQGVAVNTAFGTSLQVTATEATTNLPLAGVTVNFSATTSASGASVTVSSFTATTGVSGVASFPAVANGVTGSYTVTAAGAATPDGTPAGSPSFSLTNLAMTTTTLTALPQSPNYGQLVTLKATITSAGGTPTGTVTFVDSTSGLTLATNVPVNAGVATTTSSTLAAGPHTIQATYNPTGNSFAGSTATVTFTVVKKRAGQITSQ